jgi:hypothetical protein
MRLSGAIDRSRPAAASGRLPTTVNRTVREISFRPCLNLTASAFGPNRSPSSGVAVTRHTVLLAPSTCVHGSPCPPPSWNADKIGRPLKRAPTSAALPS